MRLRRNGANARNDGSRSGTCGAMALDTLHGERRRVYSARSA
jgi:hypothetical protein